VNEGNTASGDTDRPGDDDAEEADEEDSGDTVAEVQVEAGDKAGE